ncbi:MAG: hypothetical protein HUU37_10390 [Bdellovibrionales bacterium]|nr:hypothetical protein [Bdellovibrionales bacterium]
MTPEKRSFRHAWILDLLRGDPTLVERSMFGCRAAYLDGKLALVLADGEKPWNGLLLPTSREHHAQLREKWRALRPHPVLGKWLWIPEASPSFEDYAAAICREIRSPLIGVEPRGGTRSRKKRHTKKII